MPIRGGSSACKIYLRKDRRPATARELPPPAKIAADPAGRAARGEQPAEPEHATGIVTRLVHAIVLSWGWRRRLIAFAAGALSALAMAPFNAWPVLFLTFPTLVWLIDGAGIGRWGGVAAAAAIGWWFGFGYFVAGLYWIGYAFLVDAPDFGWLLPIAVIGLPAVLAIYTALGVALARAAVDSWRSAHFGFGRSTDDFGMAARSFADRIPLERVRLCPDGSAGFGASRFAVRHLGFDLHRHCRVCQPRDA